MSALPEFLASIEFNNPAEHRPSLFGFARHTDRTMFEWLETQPEQRAIFAEYQSATSELADYQLRPFLKSVLSQPVQVDSGVVFVDVGGGRGATLREVCQTLSPNLAGRVILQDLPKVVEGLETEDGVEAMPYNFFEPQPLKGG
jgi:hypothetical protein